MKTETNKRKARLQLSLSPEDPGYSLLNLIVDKISAHNLTAQHACDQMSIPTSYFSKLRKREATTDKMPSEYYRGMAEFLNTSPVVVRMLADQITTGEFYRVSTDIPLEIGRCIDFISKDPDWMPFVPSDIASAKDDIKLLIIKLYEKAKDISLMPGKIDYDAVINSINSIKNPPKND